MTLKQFFERLPKDGWYLYQGRFIRWGSTISDHCCPIIAAFDPNASNDEYDDVALDNGMDHALADRIANAADEAWMIDPTIRRIRRLLLRHCGLVESK